MADSNKSRDDLARLMFTHMYGGDVQATPEALGRTWNHQREVAPESLKEFYDDADVILDAGWVPGELLAAEQARSATLADTLDAVRAELVCGGSRADIRCRQAIAALDHAGDALDGHGEEET